MYHSGGQPHVATVAADALLPRPEIGRGGMGGVYEALDTQLKRKVAVKFLGDGGQSADRRRRFLQEARAASSLNHPNLVLPRAAEPVAGQAR
jgi:serine/threonine protein kinase